MKRHTIILAAVMLLAMPAAAQYTPYFRGDHITIGETEVGAQLEIMENVPWSIPDPSGYVMHGWLEATPDQLLLRFDLIYAGSPQLGYIIGVMSLEWRNGKAFPWVQDMGCYAQLYTPVDDPTRMSFELVTVHAAENVAYLFDGGLLFTGSPPIWWDLDPNRGLFGWRIQPFGDLFRGWESLPVDR